MADRDGSFLNIRRPGGLLASGLVHSPATVRDAKASARRSKMTSQEYHSLRQLDDSIAYPNASLLAGATPIAGSSRKTRASMQDPRFEIARRSGRYSVLGQTADYTMMSDLSEDNFELDTTRNLLEPKTPGGFTEHMGTTIQYIPGEDPGLAATSGLFMDFKHCLQKHESASDVFDLLASYEEVCLDNEKLLKKVIGTTRADPTLNATNLLEMVRDEKRTWRLIACLYSDRLKTEALEGSMIVDNMEEHACEKRTVDALFKENDEVRQAQIVIDWLEQNSADDLDDEVVDKVQHYSEIVSWENTLHYLNQKKLRGDTGPEERHIVSQMDPDAPSRQRKPLADLDRSDEIRLLKSMFSFIRAGKIEKAQNLCMYCGQPWRVVSLEGWKLYSDPNCDTLTEDGPAEIEGNPLRDLWKLASWSISQDETVHIFERAIYGSLCGNLRAMINVCSSWEDFLWAHFKAMTDTMVEHELRHSPTLLSRVRPECADGLVALPESYWEQRVNLSPKKIFERIQAISNEIVRQEADSPFHIIQKYVILEDIASLIEEAYSWIQESVEDGAGDAIPNVHPQLLRFLSHLVLFLRTIGVSMDEDKCEALLEAYVRYLAKEDRSASLVAIYTAALNPSQQVLVYSDFLKTIEDKGLRQEYLELASEAGLDIPTITKTVVEDIRQQGDIDLTLQGERSMGMNLTVSDEAFDPSLEPAMTRDDRRKIESLEWLVFDPSQRAEALKQSNALMRSFLAAKKFTATKEVFQKIPAGSVEVVHREWNSKVSGSTPLPPEDENAIREHICMEGYLSAMQSFNEWFKYFHHSKPTMLEVPRQTGRSERKFPSMLAQEHRENQHEEELKSWSNTCRNMCSTLQDKIYNVLMFPAGGWLVDIQPMEENDETRRRSHQLDILRRMYIPTLCHLLLTALKNTEGMNAESMHLADVIASEDHQLYKVISKEEGRKILWRIQDAAVGLL